MHDRQHTSPPDRVVQRPSPMAAVYFGCVPHHIDTVSGRCISNILLGNSCCHFCRRFVYRKPSIQGGMAPTRPCGTSIEGRGTSPQSGETWSENSQYPHRGLPATLVPSEDGYCHYSSPNQQGFAVGEPCSNGQMKRYINA